MTDDMKILVTGGAGFIGSHVSERLVQRGDRICILDNFNDSYDPAIKRANIQALADSSRAKVVVGDVRDQVLLADLFGKKSPTSMPRVIQPAK